MHRLVRRVTAWSVVSETVPLYALYALLFVDAGLTDAQVSGLFALWSVVGLLAEIPAGVAADRFSRRAALVVSGLLGAAGFAAWGLFPDLVGFAVGFALWGLGGACASGAVQAAVYDGMLAHGCADDFGRVQGRIDAAGLVAQVPAALAATALFTVGGYPAVTTASVVVCLAAAALAAGIPDIRPGTTGTPVDAAASEPAGPAPTGPALRARDVLRSGLRTAGGRGVLGAVAAIAVIGALDDLEEYFPLLASRWGAGTAVVPLWVLVVPLAGAVGAVVGGRLAGSGGWVRPVVLLGAGLLLTVGAAAVARPAGILLVAGFYGLHRVVTVMLEVILQDRITGAARATVGSIAEVGVGAVGLSVFAAWALGGLPAVLAVAVVFTGLLPWLLRERRPRP